MSSTDRTTMRPLVKLAAYVLLLIAVLGAGAALGAIAGPIDVRDEPRHERHDATEPPPADDDADHGWHSDH